MQTSVPYRIGIYIGSYKRSLLEHVKNILHQIIKIKKIIQWIRLRKINFLGTVANCNPIVPDECCNAHQHEVEFDDLFTFELNLFFNLLLYF